ncbi:MAG: PEP-CTERM sorting domain-containing protein [Lysobacteraceae bacterium]|nr:MAG: PEP-CTERM sorting domain-containing protein [Xanthomonadaceae bacterium]
MATAKLPKALPCHWWKCGELRPRLGQRNNYRRSTVPPCRLPGTPKHVGLPRRHWIARAASSNPPCQGRLRLVQTQPVPVICQADYSVTHACQRYINRLPQYRSSGATIPTTKSLTTMSSQQRSLRKNIRKTTRGVRKRPVLSMLMLAGTACVGIGVTSMVPGSLFSASPANAAVPAVLPADIDNLLDARSPGSRRYGWLLNTKAGYAPESPTERVLTSVRRRPTPVGPGQSQLVEVPGAPNAGALVPGSVPGDVIGFRVPASITGPGGTGALSGIGGVLPGSGGGVGGGNSTNPVTPQVPTTAVPEPTSWVMLVLGFAMLGGALRRRQPLSMFAGSPTGAR